MTARTRVNLSAAVLLDAVGGVIAAEPETILCDPELQGSGFSLQCVTPGKKDRHFAAKLRRVDFPARSRSSGQGADARFGAASWKVIPVPAEPPAATLLLRKAVCQNKEGGRAANLVEHRSEYAHVIHEINDALEIILGNLDLSLDTLENEDTRSMLYDALAAAGRVADGVRQLRVAYEGITSLGAYSSAARDA